MIKGIYQEKKESNNLLWLNKLESKNQIDICIFVVGNSLGRLVDFNLKTGRILRRYNIDSNLKLDLDNLGRLNYS